MRLKRHTQGLPCPLPPSVRVCVRQRRWRRRHTSRHKRKQPFMSLFTGDNPKHWSALQISLVSAFDNVLSVLKPAQQQDDNEEEGVRESKEAKEEKVRREDRRKAEKKDNVLDQLPPGAASNARVAKMWAYYTQHSTRASGLQYKLTQARERLEVKAVMERLSPVGMAVARSASVQGASLALVATPYSAEGILPDAHLQVAYRVHLGLPLSSTLPVQCACSSNMQVQPLHLLHCDKFPKNMVTSRHDGVKHVLASYARLSGATVQEEVPIGHLGRRMDLAIYMADKMYMVDVSVRDPASKQLVLRSAVDAKAAAAKATREKRAMYLRMPRQVGSSSSSLKSTSQALSVMKRGASWTR